MKKLSLIFIIGILFSTGCIKYEFNYQKEAPLNRYFNLNYAFFIHVRQTLTNRAEKISITFDSVKSDSRCPKEAVCFWAGNGSVVFLYKKDNDSIYFTLNTLKNLGSDTTIDNYNIQLLKLLPYPGLHTAMKYNAYYAKILVKKIN